MALSYNIKFAPRFDKIKADGQIPIYWSVRVGQTTSRLPTGRTISLTDWDKKNKCIKSNTAIGELLLNYLGSKMADWRKYMLQQQTLDKPVTSIMAKAYFKENTKVTFFSFFEEQIELWAESKEYNTLKSYRSTLNVLKKHNPEVNFGDLTYTFIQKLDLYMVKALGNGAGGRFTKHKNIKAIIRQAIMKGYMTMEQNPYRFFKIKAVQGNRSFLSIAEVRQLMNETLPEKNAMLLQVRDLFLFSCFTGLRYSDVMALKWESIKSEPKEIHFKAKKTSKVQEIPLIEHSLAILTKYGKLTIKTAKTSVFPQITNQVVNRNLKVLMNLVSINKQVSFHSGRHTFATTHIQAKTNILYIKDLLGHSKLTETQLYTKSLQVDLAASMANLQNMYNKAI